MKKKVIIIVGILLAIGILAAALISPYNALVKAETDLEAKRAEIATQIQRRADLIPNFVSTVKGYSEYEQSTYTAVTEARNAVKNAQNNDQLAAAETQLDGAISVWVNAVTEAYPDLKANQQYLALQDELSGTENRIAKARNNYNEAVKTYNYSVRRFPRSIFASIFGFEQAEYFEADSGASSVPEVSF